MASNPRLTRPPLGDDASHFSKFFRRQHQSSNAELPLCKHRHVCLPLALPGSHVFPTHMFQQKRLTEVTPAKPSRGGSRLPRADRLPRRRHIPATHNASLAHSWCSWKLLEKQPAGQALARSHEAFRGQTFTWGIESKDAFRQQETPESGC